VYVAIEPRRGLCHVLLLPHVSGDWLQIYVDSLRAVSGLQTLGVVLDNAPSHKNHAVQWPEGMTPLFLPPYSPELQPAEQIFRMLRQTLANRVFVDEDELLEALRAAFQPFWDHPEIVIRLTCYPWWQTATSPTISLSP
jgi:transposase